MSWRDASQHITDERLTFDGFSLDDAFISGWTRALAAAPEVHVYEVNDDNTDVWACHDEHGWMVADRDECEVQGCENEHRTLLLGPQVEP